MRLVQVHGRHDHWINLDAAEGFRIYSLTVQDSPPFLLEGTGHGQDPHILNPDALIYHLEVNYRSVWEPLRSFSSREAATEFLQSFATFLIPPQAESALGTDL